jgi:hypothetical protein
VPVYFLLVKKNTHDKQKEKAFILAHDSRACSPWSFGPVAFGSEAKQYMMVGACGRGNLFTSWWPGSKERQVGAYLQGYTPFDQPPSTSLKLIKVPPPPITP